MDSKNLENQYKIWPGGLGNDFNGLRTNGIYAFSTVSVIFRHYPLYKINGSKILDFGSGSGRLAKLIAPHSKEYYCSDISPLFLDDCKKNLNKIPQCKYYQIKNPPYLDFEDNFFEFSFSYLSLIVNDKQILKKTIEEIDRVSQNFCLHIGNIKDFELGSLLNKKELVPMGKNTLSIEDLKMLFNKQEYIFEILSPEPSIHPGSLFLYKISENLKLHLKFGPHIYEKGSKTFYNFNKKGIRYYLKEILNIKLIQIIKYFKIKLYKFLRK